jgi:hypothetical protein
MKTFLLAAGFLLLGAGALAPAAMADTVVTTSGQIFSGQVLEESADKVVIKTDSGTVTVPRATISVLERGKAPAAPVITPERIPPGCAPKAFEEAKAAIAKANWVKAGCLLAGLLELSAGALSPDSRLAATAALTTCYLQIKDGAGAARTLRQRADVVPAEGDKRRLLAAAEALQKGSTVLNGKAVSTYEEAIAAAMEWKTAQVVAEAKDLSVKAGALNDPGKLEAAGKRCLDRLNEADLYTPGASTGRRKEVFAALADNIMTAGRRGVEKCTRERKDLSRYWQTSAADARYAAAYNTEVSRYLTTRQAAEDALRNLKVFAAKWQIPELYAERDKDCTALLTQLDELQYHLLLPGMPRQLKIAPRRIGSQ